jgi:hypothetical protein
MQMERQAMGFSQAAHKCCVFLSRGSTNTVMNVGDGKHDAQLVAFLEQPAEQSHRVGAPGNRDGYPLAGMKESVAQSGRLHRCGYGKAPCELSSPVYTDRRTAIEQANNSIVILRACTR